MRGDFKPKRGEDIVGDRRGRIVAVGVRAGGGDTAGGDEWANAKARLHKVRGTRGLDDRRPAWMATTTRPVATAARRRYSR